MRRPASGKARATSRGAYATLIVLAVSALAVASPLLRNRDAYVSLVEDQAAIASIEIMLLQPAHIAAGDPLPALRATAIKTSEPVLLRAALPAAAEVAEPASPLAFIPSPVPHAPEGAETVAGETPFQAANEVTRGSPEFSAAALQGAAVALRAAGLREAQLLRFAAQIDQAPIPSFRDADVPGVERSAQASATRSGVVAPDVRNGVALPGAAWAGGTPLQSDPSTSLRLDRDRIGLKGAAPSPRGPSASRLSALDPPSAPVKRRPATGLLRKGGGGAPGPSRTTTFLRRQGVKKRTVGHGPPWRSQGDSRAIKSRP